MHKQMTSALAHEPCECVSVLDVIFGVVIPAWKQAASPIFVTRERQLRESQGGKKLSQARGSPLKNRVANCQMPPSASTINIQPFFRKASAMTKKPALERTFPAIRPPMP
jgi:hypothetical protein